MSNLLVYIIVSIIFFLYGFSSKYKTGLRLIIFLLPFSSIELFQWNVSLSIVSLLIISYATGYVFSGKGTFDKLSLIPFRIHILLFCLLVFLSAFSLIIFELNPNIEIIQDTVTENATNYLTSTFMAIILYALIVTNTSRNEDLLACMRSFSYSLLFLFIIVILNDMSSINLPSFLKPITVLDLPGGQLQVRSDISLFSFNTYFAGFHGYVENFAEYLFVTFVLSFIISFHYKRFTVHYFVALSALSISLSFAVIAASKAYPIMVGIFLLLTVFLLRRFNSRIILLVFSIIVISYFYIFNYLSDMFISTRFFALYQKYTGEKTLYSLTALISRPDIVYYFLDIIRNAGILGVGPITVWKISGSDIPFHNLFYSIYLSLGPLGFIALFSLYIRYIALSMHTYINSRGPWKNTALSFLLLLSILLLEQIKVSSFRISYGIFQFWTLLGLIASLSVIARSAPPYDTEH